MSTQGKFVWHELMTTNIEAARTFYSQLLGWKYSEHDMGEAGKYNSIKAGEKGVGGIMAFDKSHGMPSHWIGYINVDDVDKTCERVSSLKGQVCVPPTDIPNVGRFAVVNDPQGGTFSPFKELQDMPESKEMPKRGEFCWDELLTTDPEAAASFYQNLLGLVPKKISMGAMGDYWLLETEGKEGSHSSAIMKAQHPMPRPYWLPYIAVENVDKETERAKELGAEILAGPFDIPDAGRSSIINDPTGAMFALFQGR